LENIVDKYTKIGIPKSNIIIDPGIGFAKVLKQNLIILKGLSIFHGIGCPILLGASRKKFIGTIAMEENPLNLSAGSITVGLEALNQGVQILRVHDVSQTMQALRLWKSLRMEIEHE
jgi:dihydropteroate synthase